MKDIKETTIGKNEAGLYEFSDTGIAIEMNDKAFIIKEEDAFAGITRNVYFKDRENAENYK